MYVFSMKYNECFNYFTKLIHLHVKIPTQYLIRSDVDLNQIFTDTFAFFNIIRISIIRGKCHVL